MTAVALGLGISAGGILLSWAMAARERDRIVARIRPDEPPERREIRPRDTRGRALLGSMTAALGGALLGARLAGPVVGIVGAVGGPVAIRAWRRRRSGRVNLVIEGDVREAVMAMAAAVRAGLSVRRALEEAVRDSGPALSAILERSLRSLSVGEPLPSALAPIAGISADGRLLVTVLDVHRKTGGDLPSMLDEVAAVIGQRIDARRQVRALTAQGRASGAVLAVLPVAFVALLSGTNGGGLGAFYRTPSGSMLVLLGLMLEGLGFLWIRRILRAQEVS